MNSILSLIGTTIVAIVAFLLGYYMACYISPPNVVFDNKTHGVMPTGQLFIALILAVVISIPTYLLLLKKIRKTRQCK